MYRNALSRMSIGELRWRRPLNSSFRRPQGVFDGISRPYSPGRGGEAARLRADRLHARREGRQSAVGVAEEGALRQFARRPSPATRAMQQGARRSAPRSILSGWQVAADANTAGCDVSRPEPFIPANAGPELLPPHQPYLSARPTRSSTPRAAPRSTGFVPNRR